MDVSELSRFEFGALTRYVASLGLPEQIVCGVVLAFGVILLQYLIVPKRPVIFWSLALVIAALVYNAFVLAAAFDDKDQSTRWHATEAVGVLLYGVVALLGITYSGVWTAAGWAAHPAWDVWHMLTPGATHVPEWYPGVCIGFDVIVALWVLGHALLGSKSKSA